MFLPNSTWGWGGESPHTYNTKQFSDSRRESKDLPQFWHYLSRDSIRLHRVKDDCPHPHFRCQFQAPGLLVLLTYWLQTRGSNDLLLRFSECARVVHRTQRNTTYLGLQFMSRCGQGYESKGMWRAASREVWRKRAEFPCPPQGTILTNPSMFTNMETLPSFMEASLNSHD